MDEDSIDTSSTRLSDKITDLPLLIHNFERSISGYKSYGRGDVWEYKGTHLVGDETASKLTGLLLAFGDRVNLISENDFYDLALQELRTTEALGDATLLDIGMPAHNYRLVFNMFTQTLFTIFRVIGQSKPMFKDYFSNKEEGENGKTPTY